MLDDKMEVKRKMRGHGETVLFWVWPCEKNNFASLEDQLARH